MPTEKANQTFFYAIFGIVGVKFSFRRAESVKEEPRMRVF